MDALEPYALRELIHETIHTAGVRTQLAFGAYLARKNSSTLVTGTSRADLGPIISTATGIFTPWPRTVTNVEG
jgi:hypothetical protein